MYMRFSANSILTAVTLLTCKKCIITCILLLNPVNREELVVLLRHLGVKLEEEELSNVMADLNTNGTGEITFDEFYACMLMSSKLPPLKI